MRLPDDFELSPPSLVHDNPAARAERTEPIDSFGPVNGLHEVDQYPCLGGENARAAERLVIEEVPDLVDDGQLWVLAEAAEPET